MRVKSARLRWEALTTNGDLRSRQVWGAIDVSSPDVFIASNSTFPGIFERHKKMSSGIKFCPTASFASASRLKKQSLRSCCCSFVYLLPSSCFTRWVSSFILNSLESICSIRPRSRWLLECSPASCLAPRNHCEEKREKFSFRAAAPKYVITSKLACFTENRDLPGF